MPPTLADRLYSFAPHLPPALVSQVAFQKVTAIAQHFPADITTTCGFECRLADPKPQADFFLRISDADGGRD